MFFYFQWRNCLLCSMGEMCCILIKISQFFATDSFLQRRTTIFLAILTKSQKIQKCTLSETIQFTGILAKASFYHYIFMTYFALRHKRKIPLKIEFKLKFKKYCQLNFRSNWRNCLWTEETIPIRSTQLK